MAQIILAADIREESENRLLALSTYEAFKKAGEDVFFLRVGDQKQVLDEEGLPYLSVNEIEHSVIIALREIRAFINIDSSNTLVYLATSGAIESFMTYMIHRVDHVITPDYKTAFQMVSNLQQMGLWTPVHRVPPWLNSAAYGRAAERDELKILAYGPESIVQSISGDVTYWGESNFDEWETTLKPNFEDYNVYVHMDVDGHMQAREAIMSGLIPIAVNALPFTEFIIDNLNGFLVSTSDELARAITKLKDPATREFFRLTALKTGVESMSQESWSDLFLKTVCGLGAENLNVENTLETVKPQFRRWIVPKMVLRNGQKVMVPRLYNKHRFKLVELDTVKEILTYFSMQRFMDVFVFGWEYDDISKKHEIFNILRGVGRRGLNMYFCTDEEIPDEWVDVFKHLTVLPIQEGLKKVKPLPGPNIPVA